MIALSLTHKIPAKSNCYRVGRQGARCGIFKTQALKDFENALESRAKDLVAQYGSTPFPKGVRVELWIIWHRNRYDYQRRDLGNIEKAIGDALTKGNVYNDDVQITRIESQMLYDAEDKEWILLVLREDPLQPHHQIRSKQSQKSSLKVKLTTTS